jgi:hypothetical protein
MELIKKLNFVKEIQINQVTTKSNKKNSNSVIRQPEGRPAIEDFKGFWLNSPKTLEQIRDKAWKRI